MIRLLAALVLLAYVIPGDVVLREMARRRGGPTTLHIEAVLEGLSDSWPARVTLETHPTHGFRVADDVGGRWLLARGQVRAGRQPAPVWIPPLELLTLRGEGALAVHLRALGVDLSLNQLARCGEADCFVLGGRDRPVQVWVDKDSFDVRELRRSDGSRVEMSRYAVWGRGARLPGEIRFYDAFGRVGSLSIERAEAASGLRPDDFSPRWVQP